MTEPVTLDLGDPQVTRDVAGELGVHLKAVATALGVTVTQRGTTLRIGGEDAAVERAVHLLSELSRLAAGGTRVGGAEVRHGLQILGVEPEADLAAYFRDVVITDLRKRPITARSPNQRRYVDALRRNDVVFGVGPAGTGKTYLAVAMGVAMLRKGAVSRLVLTRPAVEAGEKLGFLPGDLAEKVDPYLRPLFDALQDMVEPTELTKMMEKGQIEVAPLAFMRGRTLADAWVILDEAQNTTVEQLKMFLTRLGDRGRMVITGDPSQCDLPREKRSGLAHAVGVLDGVPGIAFVRFEATDVVRHPLVARIIDAYARDAGEAPRIDEVRADRHPARRRPS